MLPRMPTAGPGLSQQLARRVPALPDAAAGSLSRWHCSACRWQAGSGVEPRDLAADGPSHSSPRASFVCRPRAQGAAGAVPGGGWSLPPRPGARSFREERLVALLEAKPASRGVRRHSAALGLLLGAGGGSEERETVAEVTVTGGGGTVADGGRWQRPPRVPSFRGLSHGRERAPPGPAWAAGADAPPSTVGTQAAPTWAVTQPPEPRVWRAQPGSWPRGRAEAVWLRGGLAPHSSHLGALSTELGCLTWGHVPQGRTRDVPGRPFPRGPWCQATQLQHHAGDTGKACTAL